MDISKRLLQYIQIVGKYLVKGSILFKNFIFTVLSILIKSPLVFIWNGFKKQVSSVFQSYRRFRSGEKIELPTEQQTVSSIFSKNIFTLLRTLLQKITQLRKWVVINGYLFIQKSVQYTLFIKNKTVTYIYNIPTYIRQIKVKIYNLRQYKQIIKDRVYQIGFKLIGAITAGIDYIRVTTDISFTIIKNTYIFIKDSINRAQNTENFSEKIKRKSDLVSKRISYTLLKISLMFKGKSYRDPLFESETSNFPQIQTWINQANRNETAEDYMARVLVFGVGASISAVIFGAVIGILLATQFGDISLGLSTTIIPLTIYNFISENIIILSAIVSSIFFTIVALLSTFITGYLYMYNEARQAKRRIDIYFNEGVSHIYSLAEGGATIDVIIDKMADTEETTGGVAVEFQKIQDIIDYEREDITSALQLQSARTPSEDFANLLNDLQTIQESGTSPTQILQSKHKDVLNDKKAEADNLKELIDLLSEVVVIIGVAPVFFTIIFLVIAIQSDPPLTQMYVVTYVVPIILLIVSGGFALLVNQDESKSEKTLNLQPHIEETHAHKYAVPSAIRSHIKDATRNINHISDSKTDSMLNTLHRRDYINQKILTRLFNFGRNPFAALPYTITATVIYFGILLSREGIPTTDIVFTEPISFYGYYLIAPLLILFIPIIYLHDRRLQKINQIQTKIPVILDTALNSIKSGDTFAESLQKTRFGNEGVLRNKNTEIIRALDKSWNNIQWKRDRLYALRKMANELEVSEMTKTMKVITDSAEFTPDLVDVIEIERENVQVEREILTIERTSKRMAIAIVFVVVALVAGILLILDISFIGALEGVQTGGGSGNSEFGFDPAVFNTFSALFQHLAVNMAFAYGTFAGILKNGSVLTGIKYGLVSATLTFIIYTLALLLL